MTRAREGAFRLPSMLHSAKQAGLNAMKAAGGFRACARSEWRRRRLAILCYHGVSLADEHLWDPALYVTRENLESRFQLMQRLGCNVLPLSEAVARLARGTLPEMAVAITFDDGSHDFFREAVPLLQSHGLPATVYLTTYHVDVEIPVFNVALSYTIWKAKDIHPLLDLDGVSEYLKDSYGYPIDPYEVAAGVREYADAQQLSARDKDSLLSSVAEALGVDLAPLRDRRMLSLMSPAEVRQLPDLVDVQLHTHRHRSPAEREAFVQEIEDNRDRIHELIGPAHPLEHFCYPSGVYDRAQLPWLAELGVRSATTVESGLAGPHHPPLLLPRVIDTMNLSELEFEGWITGAWPRALALGGRR